jgi:hypothetical protein
MYQTYSHAVQQTVSILDNKGIRGHRHGAAEPRAGNNHDRTLKPPPNLNTSPMSRFSIVYKRLKKK